MRFLDKLRKKGLVYDKLVTYLLLLGFIVAAVLIIINFKKIFEKLTILIR